MQLILDSASGRSAIYR